MHKKEQAVQALLSQKLLPLYYHDDPALSVSVLQALYDGGIRILEYTNRGPGALSNFKELRKAADESMPGLQLGIGTIKTVAAAKDFVSAGADFIVCPTMNPAVAAYVHSEGLLWIPGCLTPTEIAGAEEAGAGLVKIFPGNILGPSYISSIRDIFPGLQFMPTGGVEAEEKNLRSWFSAGVVAVGMGSKLISKELMAAGDFNALREATRNALQLVQEASR